MNLAFRKRSSPAGGTLSYKQNLHGENYMLKNLRAIICTVCLLSILACGIKLIPSVAASEHGITASLSVTMKPFEPESKITYKWNLNEKEAPLLGLAEDRLTPAFDRSLSYPMGQFDFPIFQGLNFEEDTHKLLLPTISRDTKKVQFLEFAQVGSAKNFISLEGWDIQLTDRDSLKTFRTPDGTKYTFIRYPDGEFRCANIKEINGATLNLLYTANGLALHGLVDSSGRSITFNYDVSGISSVTQTWMANSQGFTKTWAVGNKLDSNNAVAAKYAHRLDLRAGKFVPNNAVVHEYTEEMAVSDKTLAQIFGGPNAVAGANGFEPPGLAAVYPLYRGDVIGDDGKLRLGHLSHAMHLYGSPDGRGDSPLYVPAGFTSHSNEPSPTDAGVTFYYPRLGKLTDITLVIFHVADFQITYEGERVRIGSIGGPGGSSPLYKHSHIEFYRGNTSIPPPAARAALRIDPATVFGSH